MVNFSRIRSIFNRAGSLLTKRTIYKLAFAGIVVGGSASALFAQTCCGGRTKPETPCELPKSDFLKVCDDKIINSQGQSITLRGVGLENAIWETHYEPDTQPHQIADWALKESDFQRINGSGMNVVRYALHYKWFEADSDSFVYREQAFKDLSERLSWARENGIYVILDMHLAQGGPQERGEGDALWSNRNNQERLIAVWRAIARRYKNDPTIAGYEILNEPHPPTDSNWQALAREISATIREEDRDHILVVCNSQFTADNGWWNEPFTIPDNNVLYTGHFYEPIEVTHQGAFSSNIPQGAYYPDRVVTVWDNPELRGEYNDNPSIIENTDWHYLEGNWVTLSETAPGANIGQVGFKSTNEAGMVWVDNVLIEVMDADGNITNTPLRNSDFAIPSYREPLPFDYEFKPELYYPSFWELSDIGTISLDMENGYHDPGSIRFSGSAESTLTSRLLNNYFPIQSGSKYRVSGWVKGEGLGPINGSGINRNVFTIKAFQGDTTNWNKDDLRRRISRYANWADNNGVPFYIGEFGIISQTPDGGDIRWTKDVVSILNDFGMHWTYFPLIGRYVNPYQALELISIDPERPNDNRYTQSRQNMIDQLSEYAQ